MAIAELDDAGAILRDIVLVCDQKNRDAGEPNPLSTAMIARFMTVLPLDTETASFIRQGSSPS
jgi:hypothetical protein